MTPGERLLDYRSFLRSRWPPRTRSLARWAIAGTITFAVFDVFFARLGPEPAPLGAILAVRLPWIAVPIAGLLLVGRMPGWRHLPVAIVALVAAWTLGNDLAFFQLGLAGTVVQATGIAVGFASAATLLPLTLLGRLGIFALLIAGHVALDLGWPQERPPEVRLWTDLVVVVFVSTQAIVFEHFARSQRRGFHLRIDLERTLGALEASRERAESAALAVGRLAAEVAHEVNNPLSAVKASLHVLGDTDADANERAEAARDAVESVDRIARIVADLRSQAVAHQGRLGGATGSPSRPADR